MTTTSQKRAPQLIPGGAGGGGGKGSVTGILLLRAGRPHQNAGPAARVEDGRAVQDPGQTEDGPAFQLVFGFVVGPRPLVPGTVAPLDAQAGVGLQDLGHQLTVLQKVGREKKTPAGAQQAEDEVDGLGLEETALVMAALRPGVGKVDVHGGGEARREDGGEQIEGLAAQRHPVGEPAPPRPLDQHAVVLGRQLDAEKPAAGLLLAAADQVATLAEADLDFPVASGSVTRHQLVQRQRSPQLREPGVAGRGGDPDGLDHSRSSRWRPASSATILRTSWARSLGITRTVSPVRTTTRSRTPSTAIRPASAKSRLPPASTATESPRPVFPAASRGRTSSSADHEPRSLQPQSRGRVVISSSFSITA